MLTENDDIYPAWYTTPMVASYQIEPIADYLGIPHEEAYAMAREGRFPPRPIFWGGKVLVSRTFREDMLDAIATEDAMTNETISDPYLIDGESA